MESCDVVVQANWASSVGLLLVKSPGANKRLGSTQPPAVAEWLQACGRGAVQPQGTGAHLNAYHLRCPGDHRGRRGGRVRSAQGPTPAGQNEWEGPGSGTVWASGAFDEVLYTPRPRDAPWPFARCCSMCPVPRRCSQGAGPSGPKKRRLKRPQTTSPAKSPATPTHSAPHTPTATHHTTHTSRARAQSPTSGGRSSGSDRRPRNLRDIVQTPLVALLPRHHPLYTQTAKLSSEYGRT